ncbi:MAG: chitin deacetylase, partial [Paracoccaceae bacterium]
LERNSQTAEAIAATDWDICAHGYRWIEHYHLTPDVEAEHIAKAHDSILRTTGRAPQGWYSRYSASTATRGLVVAHGGYGYDSDAYNDDLPYWTEVNGTSHLVLPYTMVTNDAKFLSGDVFSARDFSEFLIDSFDMLRAESTQKPRMMSIGLHSRIIGHPGRLAGLVRAMDHINQHDDIWICGRDQIAAHWREVSPQGQGT